MVTIHSMPLAALGDLLSGTSIHLLLLRLIGVKIGRGTYISNGVAISDFSSNKIGDNVTMNTQSTLMAHSGQPDDTITIQKLEIKSGVTLGYGAYVLGGTSVSKDILLGSISRGFANQRMQSGREYNDTPCIMRTCFPEHVLRDHITFSQLYEMLVNAGLSEKEIDASVNRHNPPKKGLIELFVREPKLCKDLERMWKLSHSNLLRKLRQKGIDVNSAFNKCDAKSRAVALLLASTEQIVKKAPLSLRGLSTKGRALPLESAAVDKNKLARHLKHILMGIAPEENGLRSISSETMIQDLGFSSLQFASLAAKLNKEIILAGENDDDSEGIDIVQLFSLDTFGQLVNKVASMVQGTTTTEANIGKACPFSRRTKDSIASPVKDGNDLALILKDGEKERKTGDCCHDFYSLRTILQFI